MRLFLSHLTGQEALRTDGDANGVARSASDSPEQPRAEVQASGQSDVGMLEAEPRGAPTVSRNEESKESESETPTVIVLQTQDSSSADASGAQAAAATDPRHQVALLYPFDGSEALGRVSVTFGDIKRLAPGEFLNDNLIDFYLRCVLASSVVGSMDR